MVTSFWVCDSDVRGAGLWWRVEGAGRTPREASHSARNTSDAPYERAASK